jgi:hypothetical protein
LICDTSAFSSDAAIQSRLLITKSRRVHEGFLPKEARVLRVSFVSS